MYSQRNEETYILRYFEKQMGRFLDIGAFDGKTFSNTRQLALNGWGGVCVEPCPSVIGALESLYKDNKKIKIIKKGIGKEKGVLPFYDFYGDAIGTFDKKHALLWEKKAKRKWIELQVPVIAVNDLFEQVGFNFDFINIDTEGWSLEILKLIPF